MSHDQLVRGSSAVRRLFCRLAGVMGHQRALHTKKNGFAHATLPWHISTFRGYRILFSIRNPYVHRFTYFFLFIHNHLTLTLTNRYVSDKSSRRKLYGRHRDLVDRYGISVSQMTTDMFPLS